MNIREGMDTIKVRFNEDPVPVILVGAVAVTAIAKLIDSISAAQGRRAYAKQVHFTTRRRK